MNTEERVAAYVDEHREVPDYLDDAILEHMQQDYERREPAELPTDLEEEAFVYTIGRDSNTVEALKFVDSMMEHSEYVQESIIVPKGVFAPVFDRFLGAAMETVEDEKVIVYDEDNDKVLGVTDDQIEIIGYTVNYLEEQGLVSEGLIEGFDSNFEALDMVGRWIEDVR
ncbi:MAG: hypothetical protein ABEJ56_02165 [Candidatus Nanohaloarchaea archaeon]